MSLGFVTCRSAQASGTRSSIACSHSLAADWRDKLLAATATDSGLKVSNELTQSRYSANIKVTELATAISMAIETT
jgi:hypothetical protein